MNSGAFDVVARIQTESLFPFGFKAKIFSLRAVSDGSDGIENETELAMG
jgi:hypothetical protein